MGILAAGFLTDSHLTDSLTDFMHSTNALALSPIFQHKSRNGMGIR